MKKAAQLTIIIAAILSTTLFFCGINNPEKEQQFVVTVVDSSNNPVENATVQYRTSSYVPEQISDSASDPLSKKSQVTDIHGTCTFTKLSSGDAYFEASYQGKFAFAKVDSNATSDKSVAVACSLSAPGSIHLNVPARGWYSFSDVFIYIRGTDHFNHADSNGTILIDSIPCGMVPFQLIIKHLIRSDSTAVVKSAAVTEIPPLGFFVGDSNLITDGGFEIQNVGSAGRLSSYQWEPVGTAWTFTRTSMAGSGISANGAGFSSGNPAPEGAQICFLQGLCKISQAVILDTGTYFISFKAAQRNTNGLQVIRLLIDSTTIGEYQPAAGTSYQLFTPTSFTISAGTHTVTFEGLDPAATGATVLIDDIRLTKGNSQ